MENYFWNMFALMKNGQLARRASVCQRKKEICETFLKILWKEGFIIGYSIKKKEPSFIKIFLKYNSSNPAINNIKLITRPGRRIYFSAKQIWKIDTTKNCVIFSTHRGLKTINDCKRLKIGGEPFIFIN